jgi:hypothetical protein
MDPDNMGKSKLIPQGFLPAISNSIIVIAVILPAIPFAWGKDLLPLVCLGVSLIFPRFTVRNRTNEVITLIRELEKMEHSPKSVEIDGVKVELHERKKEKDKELNE